MMIAMARFTQRFGLSAVGVQYQQGLAQSCAASDFAEGAIGSTARFPIPDESGNIIRPGKPITSVNEVDMGTAIPQTMLFRLLDSLGLPSETTLHDIRWGASTKHLLLGSSRFPARCRSSTSKRHRRRHRPTASPRCTSPRAARRSTAGQGRPPALSARPLRGHADRPAHRPESR
jgi:hypothetical protein